MRVAARPKGSKKNGAALARALAVFVGAALAGAATYGAVRSVQSAKTRPATQIVAEFDALKSPGFSMELSNEEFERRLRAVVEGQCARAWELFQSHPRDANVPRVLFIRWMNRLNYYRKPQEVYDETTEMLRSDLAPRVAHQAQLARADAAVRLIDVPLASARELVEGVIASATRDDEPGWPFAIVSGFATARLADPREQRALLDRAAELEKRLSGEAPQLAFERVLARVGQPLALEFDDALGGAHWSLATRTVKRVLVHVGSTTDLHFGDAAAQAATLEARRLRELASGLGLEVVTIERPNSADEAREIVARARNAKLAGPMWCEYVPFDDQWAGTLGINEPVLYLLIDARGRLEAICRRWEPLLARR